MTVGRVPRELVPRDGFAVLRDCLSPVGFEQQLSIPYRLAPGSSRAFVFAQSGEDYSDEDLELARLIQPLLALLARQADLLEGLGCPEAAANGLTGRELVVLRLLSEGRTAVSIAHALQVSPRTVHTHLAHIYRKLGVCDRMRAVLVATELGVLDPPPQPRVPSRHPPRGAEMSVTDTESTLRDYMNALLGGGDFAAFFSDDVLWTTMETGDEIRGRDAVRDYIVALHSELFEAAPELRSLAVADGIASLEADFVGKHVAELAGVPATGAEVRLPYAMFYDVEGGSITALRAYFPITVLVQKLQEAAP